MVEIIGIVVIDLLAAAGAAYLLISWRRRRKRLWRRRYRIAEGLRSKEVFHDPVFVAKQREELARSDLVRSRIPHSDEDDLPPAHAVAVRGDGNDAMRERSRRSRSQDDFAMRNATPFEHGGAPKAADLTNYLQM
jgi:hypothetical protein